MSTWLVDKTSALLDRKVDRRGFLRRAALVGTALVASPLKFTMQPVSAYAAICSCSGSSCNCSDLCCDGYTEFCCTLTGENGCPPGSTAAGWWKADGSGFCTVGGVSQPRYYIDCNASCNGCTCGGSGLCSRSCASCNCECGNKSCKNRKACCTSFRYGQCGNDVTCLGPIICRVITCTPPWVWDSSCSTTSATDNNTRFHDAPCLHRSINYPALPGVYTAGNWTLKNGNATASPNTNFSYGLSNEIPVMGDWNGDGTRTPGVVRNSRFGRLGDEVLWWRLKNSVGGGQPDLIFSYGRPGDIPIVGDWNGSGVETVGVIRGNEFRLRNANGTGEPDNVFTFGQVGDQFIVGDWNGDGVATPGYVRNGTWYLRNSNSAGQPDIVFNYGLPTDTPIVGDWDGNGSDTPGVIRNGTTWLLRNGNWTGGANISLEMPPGTPVIWSASPTAMPELPVPETDDGTRLI